MFRSNPLLWRKPPAICGYGIATLLATAAVAFSQLPAFHLQTAPSSLFLCAVLLSAWFGGLGPGMLATALCALAFYYCFLPPPYSMIAKPGEIPRFGIFVVAALSAGALSAAQRSATESLRRARDYLAETVKELQRTNQALRAESHERESAEEALHQARADVAHVNRVTTMGELTASLAHEVNQPIAAAVTNANTCLRWLASDTPNLEEARAAALRVVTDGRRAAEIISRVRQLFKKGTTERELVDVNEVIREMVVLLRGEAARQNISVRTELAVDLPPVMGDRVQLQQVMMNLMINGIDAMKDVDGTRELGINSRLAENEEILVSVSDTGVGLPLQQADKIFNAFFTTKLHGTGMGLRISGTIVESHGGRLWADGNSPRGASFYFTLPTRVEAHE
jgi:C4-dicarboxylate-specific signal transduction histidine kinase